MLNRIRGGCYRRPVLLEDFHDGVGGCITWYTDRVAQHVEGRVPIALPDQGARSLYSVNSNASHLRIEPCAHAEPTFPKAALVVVFVAARSCNARK